MKTRKNGGFTLMEIMTVVAVSAVGLLGVSSLVVQNLQAQNVNRHYPVAAMLAQEGIELVRNMRDNNWLAGGDWLTSDEDIVGDGTYIIGYDPDSGGIDVVNDFTSHYPEIVQKNGFYTHDVSSPNLTNYRRIISVMEDPAGQKIIASSTVQWTNRGHDYNYSVKAELYDWR